MLKHLSICAALVALTIGSATAQEREAILQKVEVPGAGFDMLVAVAKSPGVTLALGNSPDALLIHLVGGELAVAFDDADEMLKAIDQLRGQAFAFHAQSKDGTTATPVAIYIVPRADTRASSRD